MRVASVEFVLVDTTVWLGSSSGEGWTTWKSASVRKISIPDARTKSEACVHPKTAGVATQSCRTAHETAKLVEPPRAACEKRSIRQSPKGLAATIVGNFSLC